MWNGTYTAPLWSGQATTTGTKSNQNLYLSNVTDDNPYIGITNGNSVQLPSSYDHLYVTNLSTFATALNDTLLTASDGLLYANGVLVNGNIPAESNVDMWATFPAVSNVNVANHNIIGANSIGAISITSSNVTASNVTASTITTSSITAVAGTFSTITTSSIRANVATVSTLSGLQGSFSNFTFSSIKGNYANISTLNNSTMYVNVGYFSTLYVSSLIGGWSNYLSNWSYYKGLSDVNINHYNINNVVTLNTQGVYAYPLVNPIRIC